MDFFEQQHNARRQTRLMVVMFIAAVAAIVVTLNVAGALFWVWNVTPENALLDNRGFLRQAPRGLYVGITVVTLVTIAWGTISTLFKLSSGGVAVAKMVGARLVRRDSKDPLERRLLNIVEEMAIASGITIPWAYVMDEERAINAFAAGYSPNEAVVAVTRGALETLTRDELQGVIGHEFSHILNGDMRLNIHLMGVIAGIVMIGSLGRFLMDVNRNRSGSSSNRESDSRVFMIGLCLWLIGSIGVFASRIIKAAIARQREFLADASAVQFTRNPEGIGSALYKIGVQGGAITERHAEDLSHMYFDAPITKMFNVFNTHPPIEERVERLMGPGAQLQLAERIKRQPRPDAAVAAAGPVAGAAADPAVLPEGVTSQFGDSLTDAAASANSWGRASTTVNSNTVNSTVLQIIDSVGKPTPAHFQAARGILKEIPRELHDATASPEGAQALLFALLLGDGEVRATQLAAIDRSHGAGIGQQAERFVGPLRLLGPRARMPIMELIIPTLKQLPQPARESALAAIKVLAEADHKVTLGEFVLLTLCRRHLSATPKGGPPVKHKNIDSVAAEITTVLSVLAYAGKGGKTAFERGMQALGMSGGALRPPAELSIAAVEGALYELKLLAPLKKPALIKACFAAVMADAQLTVIEGELMRALCAALDSPLPPLLEVTEPVN